MKFDRNKVFAAHKKSPNLGALSVTTKGHLDALLTRIEADTDLQADTRWMAYLLATSKWESGHTYAPEAEKNYEGRVYARPVNGLMYYGRGLVQLTWRENYQIFSKLLGIDLLNNPDKALELDVAYKVASIGMRGGHFTGKKLGDFFNATRNDPVQARRIINGQDRAVLISQYHYDWQEILKQSAI